MFISKITSILYLSYFVLRLKLVCAEEELTIRYFLVGDGNIVLEQPFPLKRNQPMTVVWEWMSHDGLHKNITLVEKQLKRSGGGWNVERSDNKLITHDNFSLIINASRFENAGYFTCRLIKPYHGILKQYEVFAVKVVPNTWNSVPPGEDVSFSCTISKLSDAMSLQWLREVSPQQHKRNNIDELQINNTRYLMIRGVADDDVGQYKCIVQKKSTVEYSVLNNLTVKKHVYENYILYRPSVGNYMLNLICKSASCYEEAVWNWTPQSSPQENKQIASAVQDGNITVNIPDFGNRMKPSVINFDGKYFPLQIEPVLFEDAGDFACYFEKTKRTTITLITVKVSAESPMAPVEEGNIILTCSVSEVSKGVRLLWLGNDNKTVIKQKRLSDQERELALFIQNVSEEDHSRMCVVFQDNLPRALIYYHLKVKGQTSQMQKSPEKKENRDDSGAVYSNICKMQEMKGVTEKDTMTGDKITSNSTEAECEGIHYASLTFENQTSGLSDAHPSDIYLKSSADFGPLTIYADINVRSPE
ncbi:uncharacterized protein [Heptranchias perlo]|uniref:uncharacterized protein isoform X2 n=1 Tax=Heptranchias perlo TaxID=212740 RepID=UPI00355A3CAB